MNLETFSSTLLATVVGAYFAFRLERHRRDDERQEERIEASYRAMLALSMMRDDARGLIGAMIDPWRNKPSAWFEMKPIQSFPSFDQRIDTASIAFLFASESATRAQAAQNAVFAERTFYAWREGLRARNGVRLEATRLLGEFHTPGKNYTREELGKLFGQDRLNYLEQSALSLPAYSDEVLELLRKSLTDIHEAVADAFPAHRIQFPNELDQPSSLG